MLNKIKSRYSVADIEKVTGKNNYPKYKVRRVGSDFEWPFPGTTSILSVESK